MKFFDTLILDNTLQQWTSAVAVAIAALIVLRFVVRMAAQRVRAVSERTNTILDDVVAELLEHTRLALLTPIALLAGAQALTLSGGIDRIVTRLAVVALVIQGGLWAVAGLTGWLRRYRAARLQDDPAAVTTVGAMGFVGKLLIWSVVLLLTLDNLGVDVTALVTGMGIGGIAVALAVQNVLGDLFASLSIVLDKPFVIGDFLSIGEHMGSVEHIGLKTTRLRSLSGEQLIFSNSDLLGSRIRNFGRMFERRVMFTIGVTYRTPRAQLTQIQAMLRHAVEAQEHTRFDRSHFKTFGPSSLDFETVYYVTSPEYLLHMDVQQAINLEIHERFEAEGIEFAYPTQTIYVEKVSTGS